MWYLLLSTTTNFKPMKKTVLAISILGALVLLGGCGYTQTQTQPTKTEATAPNENKAAANSVTIKNFTFSPSALAIKAGTTVVWTNQDSAHHSIKSENNAFNSTALSEGDSFRFKFESPGNFGYICGIHPSMKGEITVE